MDSGDLQDAHELAKAVRDLRAYELARAERRRAPDLLGALRKVATRRRRRRHAPLNPIERKSNR